MIVSEIANKLGLREEWLRHLSRVTRLHYAHWKVKKRSGGTRSISAPIGPLSLVQRRILDRILCAAPIDDHVHGFVRERSIVTSAIRHVGRDVVVNFDIVNFFPSITVRRVRGVFISLGHSRDAADLLALLCTEHPRGAAVLRGDRIWVPAGPRALPQGACTSPAISNLVARKLDSRLASIADKLGFSYTRYADDLAYSAASASPRVTDGLRSAVSDAVEAEGFALNHSKTTEVRAGARQVVTGLIVNSRPALPREEVRRLRAAMHGAARTGLIDKERLRGQLAYLHMVDPAKAAPMLSTFNRLSAHTTKEFLP